MEFKDLSVIEIAKGIKEQKFTSESVVAYFIDRCNQFKDYNAVVEVFDDAIEKAKQIDKKIQQGETVGKLAGVPIAIKDNILNYGKKMSCASNFMKDFISPYSATIVKKLENEGAIFIGRTNMDEFAMGGSTENSIYGACKNAINPTKVAGGSSGGSAVAVALGLAPCALGTDTGGSIRQPSSFNGVVGIKPTYGTVSRYGIVAFASSTDQASPITKTIEDNELLLSIISGKDKNDGTTIENDFQSTPLKETYKIGICKQLIDKINQLPTANKFNKAIQCLKNNGFEIVEIDVPHITSALACYYILTPAEATSNLDRFDGVKYTNRSENARTLEDIYVMSRSEGFGKEVKRRIMLGNFVLSSGYFDAYYNSAKRVQTLLRKEFADAFQNCDCIMMPTTPNGAFGIGEKITDPISMYLEDLFTVPASISGNPALNVPYEMTDDNMPLGMQFMGANKSEHILYDIASKFTKIYKGDK